MDIDIIPDTAEGLSERKRKRSPDKDDNLLVQIDSRVAGVIPGLNITSTNGNDHGSYKRPRPPSNDENTSLPPQAGISMFNSKLKLTDLPPEILQHIFSFVDPFSLGRVICVSSIFHTLLHPGKLLPQDSNSTRCLSLRNQNEIWASSRRAFLPRFPRPMDSMSELSSLQLAWGKSCAFCKRKSQRNVKRSMMPWTAGPSMEVVRPIWPFHIRCCGQCLEKRLIKELDLILSKSYVLIPGLPFALFTSDLNYVTSLSLRQTQLPLDLKLTKYYFRPQVEDLESKLQEVRDLGIAAAEEWYKGLESTGQSLLTEAARFEKFQFDGTLSLMPEILHRNSTPVQSAVQESDKAETDHSTVSRSPARSSSTVGKVTDSPKASNSSFLPISLPDMPLNYIAPAPGQSVNLQQAVLQTNGPRTYLTTTAQVPLAPPQLNLQPPKQRAEKSFRDVVQLKADRRAEIERRCQLLDPPIDAPTLTYMEAFNAAIQIPMALNDNAWELLKTRIILQRAEAEQKERDHRASIRASETQAEDLQKHENELQLKTEMADHTWIEIQKPSRDKIKLYADDYTKSYWSEGRAVSKANSSKFAAEVLHHVKRKFDEAIAQENTILAAQGLSMPSNPDFVASRKLKLEDMKWVFEECVKPHTERYTRELFLCSACDGNNKHFSLDAVIQHYAAKHTHTLSHGNAVVWWKADWPMEPIFDLNPDRILTRDKERHIAYSPAHAVSPAYAGSYTFHPSPALSFTQPYTPFPYSTSPAHSARPSTSNWLSSIAPGQPNGIYHIQSDELVKQAREVWDQTDGIRDLTSNVRLYITVHYVALGFSQRFTNEPTLSLFLDCINNKPSLRPLKEIQDLQCKTCQLNFANSLTSLHGWKDHHYALPDLLTHFQKSHIEFDPSGPQTTFRSSALQPGGGPSRLDWKYDMLQLPEHSMIRELMYSPGIDQRKLELIARVFPNIFPEPIPRIEPVLYVSPHDVSTELDHPIRKPSSPMRTPLESGQLRNVLKTHVSPILRPLADDEYDPHRPAPTVTLRRSDRSHHLHPYSPPDLRYRSVVYHASRPHPQRHYSPAIADNSIEQPARGAIRRIGSEHEPHPDIDFRFEGAMSRDRRYHSHLSSHQSEISAGERPVSPPDLSRLSSPVRMVRTPGSSSIQRQEALNPITSTLSAAEQFLNNFDEIANGTPGTTTPTAGSSRRTGLENEISDGYLEPFSDGRPTLHRAWHPVMQYSGSATGSRGERSRSPPPMHKRCSNSDLLPSEPIRQLPPRSDSPRPEIQGDASPLHRVRMSSGREDVLDQDRHSRLRPIEYDRSGLPIGMVETRSRRAHDIEDRYYDPAIALEQREVRDRTPPSPEIRRHRIYDRPIRYVEVVGSSASHYVDDRSYLNERYEPVEYIRIGPPRGGPNSESYYTERSIRSYPEGYVGFDRRYEHEMGNSHDEQFYDRIHPVREHRYEPPEEGERYDRP